jgi:hypothetical protein
MAVEITLAEKVYAALADDHGFGEFAEPQEIVGAYPTTGGGYLTDFELDCRGWGLAVGIAYGIARGEDVYEPERSVCERALAAAREAYERFGGPEFFTAEAYREDRATRPEAAKAVA